MNDLDRLFAWAGREHDIAIAQHATSKELGNHQQAARHESYAKAMRKVQAKIVQLTIDTKTKISESVGVVSKATSNTDLSGKPT